MSTFSRGVAQLRGINVVNHSASGGDLRNNGRANARATNCAMMKPGTSIGLMPANVSDSERAIVTAGLAKLVDAVTVPIRRSRPRCGQP
jgi:hypothetical protein